MADQLPEEIKECKLHSTLTTEGFVIMGFDMITETKLIKGNAVSLLLNCSGEKEIRLAFDTLSNDGNSKYPLKNTFWDALFGDVTDKFGNN